MTTTVTAEKNTADSLDAVIRAAGWDAALPECGPGDRERMQESQDVLAKALASDQDVYGITRGFGPLVAFQADSSHEQQGSGLIAHLGTGQGDPLAPEVCRLVVWIRLNSMRKGHSGVSPDFWDGLAELWNRGFTPVIPREGTVSASGDLQPLAHAALAYAGVGEAWQRTEDGTFTVVPAAEALRALGVEPIVWPAREALAFVNGTSVGLAVAVHNHAEVARMVRAVAGLTARMAGLLGSNPEAYEPGFAHVRGQRGQLTVAEWIRADLPAGAERAADRPLQEPYSVRCVPQILGAVQDQLDFIEQVLCREANGTTDNPICFEGEVLHGGNFHAMPVGLSSDQTALCLQQVAYLADRQLSLLCTPTTNGELAPMLTPRPGSGSGLAGVQLSATSFVAKIRQLCYPASLTTLPTNGGNQDHVPMALNGANSVSEAVKLAWLTIGSLALGLTQYSALTGRGTSGGGLWDELARVSPPLDRDRPLAAEVRAARDAVSRAAADWLEEERSS
ncbi:histidine ammonia-lyase [Nocardiopsis terrae]|uniref:Histidine ammonia-lyase n=1 Tax=Nocardiopsis terrae TaxID=372655 RepID=A0ABR9HAC1_9ACTN|nr:aromatic amino acid ammonia-lyase [Nocardiopsis terrae]MBE1455971.1 histidine ammonia-lyase [Nocardiopsis terrae]GHC96440.1 histidine ammonia-lyase [Nocardiopsis terrae]